MTFVSDHYIGTGSWITSQDDVQELMRPWVGTGPCAFDFQGDSIDAWDAGLPLGSFQDVLAAIRSAGEFSTKTLASLFGVSARSIASWKAGEMPSEKHVRRAEDIREILATVGGVTSQELAFRVMSRIGGRSIVERLAFGEVDSAKAVALQFARLRAEPIAGRTVHAPVFRRDTRKPNPLTLPDEEGRS